MLVGAGLLALGAGVNAVGIRNPQRVAEEAAPAPPALAPAAIAPEPPAEVGTPLVAGHIICPPPAASG